MWAYWFALAPPTSPDATVVVPDAAAATADALTPVAKATVVAPQAAATADAVTPAVKVTPVAPQADATGDALAPGANASVTSALASASADALTPVVKVVVVAQVADATADALAPTVSASSSVTAPQATATADALAPAVATGTVVTSPLATATADAFAPAVNGSLTATLADASASALAPTLRTTVVEPIATATADALVPTVSVSANATVVGVLATATADALTPTVKVTVVEPVATATAAANAPTVTTGAATVAAVQATATAVALVPTLTTVNAVVLAPTALAWAGALRPNAAEVVTSTRMFRVGPGDHGCWFEKALPVDAPIHANSHAIIDALGNPTGDGPAFNRGDGNYLYVKFSGGADGSDTTSFDVPIYRVREWSLSNTTIFIHSKSEAPDYPGGWSGFVGSIPDYMQPGEDGVLWPAHSTGLWDFFDVTQAVSSDSPVILYDSTRGYYAQFAEMRYYPSTGLWYAQEVNVFETGSYGITSGNNDINIINEPGSWPATLIGTGYDPADYQDAAGNVGARGNNPMCRAVDYNRQLAEDQIAYAVELFAWDTAPGNVYTWPMMNGEDRGTPLLREGTRLRLKHSVDIDAEVNLYHSAASAGRQQQIKRILTCLQDYGCFIGDTSGSGSRIRLENLLREGRPNLWQVKMSDLKYWNFSPDRWEVIVDNYDPPLTAGGPTPPPSPGPGDDILVGGSVSHYSASESDGLESHTLPYPSDTEAGDPVLIICSTGDNANDGIGWSWSEPVFLNASTAGGFRAIYSFYVISEGETEVTVNPAGVGVTEFAAVLVRVDGSDFSEVGLNHWDFLNVNGNAGIKPNSGSFEFDPGALERDDYTALDPAGYTTSTLWLQGMVLAHDATADASEVDVPDAPSGWALADATEEYAYDSNTRRARLMVYYRRENTTMVTFPEVDIPTLTSGYRPGGVGIQASFVRYAAEPVVTNFQAHW